MKGALSAVGGTPGFGIGGDLGTVEAYDPLTDAWNTKTSMPTARRELAVGAVDDKLYAVGGFRDIGALRTVEAYYPGQRLPGHEGVRADEKIRPLREHPLTQAPRGRRL